jgi:hypothetical protein
LKNRKIIKDKPKEDEEKERQSPLKRHRKVKNKEIKIKITRKGKAGKPILPLTKKHKEKANKVAQT